MSNKIDRLERMMDTCLRLSNYVNDPHFQSNLKSILEIYGILGQRLSGEVLAEYRSRLDEKAIRLRDMLSDDRAA